MNFCYKKDVHLVFPESREYREPFGWWWCQLNGKDSPGHIIDANGWLYDKMVTPTISVSLDGKRFFPFTDTIGCFPDCVTNNQLAWNVCMASKYTVPYLYSIVRGYHFNIESMYEGGFCVDDDAGLEAVMNYFDECVWPIYNVIVKEDSPVVNAGEYPMHIVDAASLEGCYLKEIIRAHKSELKRTIENANKSA